ncbi:type II toxin-antitoxin system MqsA family antitoxin [uncultured Microbulbifer sp.]|uniref:helix-turn-helix domain-containing protein n=1 Tax=uncultured Microbulbifer sp. TaxID=348147 RepID=UPI00261F686D|nr:type II toxin-antitoxin system MqsA family antitoxin [uncultured Microbulbifer sp.]
MAKRDIFSEMLEGMEALRHEREGKMTLRTHKVTKQPQVVAKPAEIRRVRKKLRMSQTVFAAALRANKRTYERWEKEGTKGAQATLLKLIDKHPELIEELQSM